MAIWQITAGQNDGYPLYDNGASTSLTLWISGVELPNKVWRIIQDVNDDYPTLSFDWIETTNLFDGIIPVNLWRIVDGINEGYPYQWFQIAVESGYINQGGAIIGSDTDMKNYIDNKDGEDTDPNPERETGIIVSNNFNRPFSIANQFVTTYVMTGAQVSNLGRILWTSFNDDTVTMDMVENFWANVQQATGTWDISAVMNFFISLTMFPFDVTGLLPSTSLQSASELFLGTGKLGLDIKGSNNLYVANYAVGIADFGIVNIPEMYGDYRDYVNTVISVYLPYCGTVQLNPSDVVGKSIACKYAVDINSGECTAFLILVDNNVERYNLVIEKGMCGFSIPITSTNSEAVRARLIDTQLRHSSNFLSFLGSGASSIESATNGNVGGIFSGIFGMAKEGLSDQIFLNSRNVASGISCAYMPGASGFSDLAVTSTAYVQIKRGIYSKPMHYNSTKGYLSNAKDYGKINSFSGYIECINANVSNMSCTEEEKSKIKALLESGVYV